MARRFVCGAGCGIVAAGTVGPAGTVGHWSFVAGAPTVAAAPAGRGGSAFRFNPTAAATRLTFTLATAIPSPATMVARCAVYFTTLPSVDTALISAATTTGGLIFKQSDSTIRTYSSAVGTQGASGITVTTGQWYELDLQFVGSATRTASGRVDGVDLAAVTSGIATSVPSLTLGSTSAFTGDFYITDLAVDDSGATYPIGNRRVTALYPDGDGVHTYDATTDFAKAGTAQTAVPLSDTTTWQSLKNPMSTTIDTTKFVSDLAGSSTEFLQWTFEAMPAGGTPQAVAVVSTNHASAATACNVNLELVDSTGAVNAYGEAAAAATTPFDLSEITIVPVYLPRATRSNGTAWDETSVNGATVQWGRSTDPAPDPYIDSVCLEVEYTPAVAAAGNPPYVSPYPQLLPQ